MYLSRRRLLVDAFAGLGIHPVLPEKEMSSSLVSFHLPAGIQYEHLHRRLKSKGFVIYAGQGHLKSMLFRIAVMGDIHDDEINRLAEAIKMFLKANEA